MTRQMLSAVSSGRMPLWRSTSRRIISASRAGRKAEPVSSVCFTLIRRSMISPRCISRLCIASSRRSISCRNPGSVSETEEVITARCFEDATRGIDR